MNDTEAKAELRAAGAQEINYPDVVGWEWTGPAWTETDGTAHPGLLHQLVWDRHNYTFMYATKREHDGVWSSIRCRGDLWQDADTLAKARAIAAEFIKPSEGD